MDAITNGGREDNRFVFRVGTVRDVEGFQIAEGKTHIDDTNTVALAGDLIRFEDGAYQYTEVPVIAVDADGDGFYIPGSYTGLVNGDEFFVLRRTSQRVDDTGAQTVVVDPEPIEFVLDGVNTPVEEDTGTPASSRPLPVKNLNQDGSVVDFATETTLALVAVDTGDIATSVAAIEADGAKEAKQDDTINAIDDLAAKSAGALVPEPFDFVALTYVAAGNGMGEVETATYKAGGSGGATVALLTLAYNSDNKLVSVTRT